MPSCGQKHVINAFSAKGIDNTAEEIPQDVEISQHLKNGIRRIVNTNSPHDGLFSNFRGIESNGSEVESESYSQDHEKFSSHGILLVNQGLEPEAVYNCTEPYEFMNSLFDSKPEFVVDIARLVECEDVDVDESEENVILLIRVADQDGDDLYDGDHYKETHQKILVLHEFEDPGVSTGVIDLVGIHQSQGSDDVQQIETALEGVEDRAISVFEVSPVASEVVVGVAEWVHQELYCDGCYHDDTEDGRTFFHGVVVFEDKPLRANPDASSEYDQHDCYTDVYFGADFFFSSQVVFAPAKELGTIQTHQIIISINTIFICFNIPYSFLSLQPLFSQSQFHRKSLFFLQQLLVLQKITLLRVKFFIRIHQTFRTFLFSILSNVIILIRKQKNMIIASSAAPRSFSSHHPTTKPPTAHLKQPCPEKTDCLKKTSNPSSPSESGNNPLPPKQDRSQTCHFKIRPLNSKKPTFCTVEGKQMGKVSGQGKKKPQLHEVCFGVKRFSVHQSPVQLKKRDNENGQGMRHGEKEINIFGGIDLFKPLEKTELKFSSNLFTHLTPLAHTPQITFNHNDNPNKKIILIISFNLLCQEGLKYIHGKTISSHRNISTQPLLPQETTSLLQKLSGPQTPKSFINQCRLFYKVRNQLERHTLERHLQENQLNYSGIINVRDNNIEQHNVYYLKQLSSPHVRCLLVEDKQVLRQQIPILQQLQTAILAPTSTNHHTLTRLIQSIKSIKLQPANCSPNKNQENMHPNTISPNKLYRSSPTKKSPSKRHSPIKCASIKISGTVQCIDTELNDGKLVEKLKCWKDKRELRQNLRASAKSMKGNSSEQGLEVGVRSSRQVSARRRDKSAGRMREGSRMGESGCINLEGEYKQKLVTFVKILETERIEKTSLKAPQVKQEKTQDELDQLTNSLTSRLKNKTPYQMVGQLLRNNNHIARQIGQYLTKVAPLEIAFSKIGSSQHSISLDGEEEAPTVKVHLYF